MKIISLARKRARFASAPQMYAHANPTDNGSKLKSYNRESDPKSSQTETSY